MKLTPERAGILAAIVILGIATLAGRSSKSVEHYSFGEARPLPAGAPALSPVPEKNEPLSEAVPQLERRIQGTVLDIALQKNRPQ